MTEFQRLGWGTMENKRDDDGSDVFVLRAFTPISSVSDSW